MLASASNKTRGLFAGGYDPNASPSNYINTIEYVNIATGGDATDFGDATSNAGTLNNNSASNNNIF